MKLSGPLTVLRISVASLALLASVPSAKAWDPELNTAIMQVYLGKATDAQLQLVRRNNHVINNMANTGHLDNKVYQKIQSDFADFNHSVASGAAKKNGLDLVTQTSTKKSYSPGTDSDFITNSPDGKMNVSQIEKTIGDYNADMNKKLGTTNVDYAKQVNTDFMANQSQMSAEDFAKVSKLNNDAYKRQGAAAYEAKVRNEGSTITVDEALDYQKEMRDLISKKHDQISDLNAKLGQSLKADPDGLLPETRNLKAELQIRQQQQAKYIERLNDSTTRTAKKFGVADDTLQSDLASKASDRSVDKPGATEADKAAQNKKYADTSSNLDDYQVKKATGESAKVNAKAAGTIDAGTANLPDREKLMNSAAQQLSELPPSQQGEIIEDVRRKMGDAHAAELAERTRKYNSEQRWLKNAAATVEKIKATSDKILAVSSIASIANDARAWVKGEKSNWEAAEAAIDMVSQGYYSTGKNLGGWAQTYDANKSAYINEQQARIYKIAKDLNDRGVPLADIKAIVSDMEAGSESSLDARIRELAAQGTTYEKPKPVERTIFSDKSWTDYAKAQGGVAVDVLTRILAAPGKLAWNTGTDVGEIIRISTDIYKTNKNISDTELEIISQQNELAGKRLVKKLVDMGATPQEAQAAVAGWMNGSSSGIESLRQLRDKLKGVEPASLPETKALSPEEKAARRAHIVDRLTKLNHTKLKATFDAIGIAPSEDFYNCLCHNAGYGSSGTAQFYHPDTIGDFNEMYSCSQPGDPCVVSGFGCSRFPLPSDANVWQSCMAENKLGASKDAEGNVDPNTGVPLDEAIEQALTKRNPANK